MCIFQVKPLGVIWGKFPQYVPANTIMFDDIRRNFLMNPSNGLRIRAFRQAHINRKTDKELVKLSKYLKEIASVEDLCSLHHKNWEKFLHKKIKEKKKQKQKTELRSYSDELSDSDLAVDEDSAAGSSNERADNI